MAATYTSIVTASAVTKEGPLQYIATGMGTVDDEKTASSATVDWSATGVGIGISVVQFVAPDPPKKCRVGYTEWDRR